MIDIHCHILPGVDDGPKTLAESLEMIGMAYENGTRQMIASSHYFHPLAYEGEARRVVAYRELIKAVKTAYPEMTIHLGAEFYIRDGFEEALEAGEKIGLANSRYLLIEFHRWITLESVLYVLHELILKGYQPVIAHVEMYPTLQSQEALGRLRDNGALIQITGSSLLGKMGKETQHFLLELLAKGWVDFVASDGHSPNTRKPLLGDAYAYITHKFGKETADKLFVSNPLALIEGQKLKPNPISRSRKGWIKRKGILVSGIIGLMLAGTGMIRWQAEAQSGTLPLTATGPKLAQTIEAKDLGTGVTPAALEALGPLTTDKAIAGKSGDLDEEKPAEPSKRHLKASVPEAQAIVDHYIGILEGYQSAYEGELAALTEKIIQADRTHEDPTEKRQVIGGYLDEIAGLEAQADKKVYDALYDMQNELEKIKAPTAEVQTLREGYQSIKSDRKTYYINKITEAHEALKKDKAEQKTD